jgi:hypothetical protein
MEVDLSGGQPVVYGTAMDERILRAAEARAEGQAPGP